MPLPTLTYLTPTKRYIAAGKRIIGFVPTIAVYTAPTSSELGAGTWFPKELKGDSGIDGFSTSSDTVDAPDYGTRFTSKVPGMITAEDSALTFYADNTGVNAVATLLPRDTTGFIVDMYAGNITGGKMGVFPVTVTVSSPTQDGAGELVGWRVGFAITNVPAENITIPSS